MSKKPQKAVDSGELAQVSQSFAEIVASVLERWRRLELLQDHHAGYELVAIGIARELEKDPGQPVLWRELRATFLEIVKTQGNSQDDINALFKDLDAALRDTPKP